MLGLIIERFIFGNGIVESTALWVWLSCDWKYGILPQQKSAGMVSETQMLYILL
jgi:hypothetical protein